MGALTREKNKYNGSHLEEELESARFRHQEQQRNAGYLDKKMGTQNAHLFTGLGSASARVASSSGMKGADSVLAGLAPLLAIQNKAKENTAVNKYQENKSIQENSRGQGGRGIAKTAAGSLARTGQNSIQTAGSLFAGGAAVNAMAGTNAVGSAMTSSGKAMFAHNPFAASAYATDATGALNPSSLPSSMMHGLGNSLNSAGSLTGLNLGGDGVNKVGDMLSGIGGTTGALLGVMAMMGTGMGLGKLSQKMQGNKGNLKNKPTQLHLTSGTELSKRYSSSNIMQSQILLYNNLGELSPAEVLNLQLLSGIEKHTSLLNFLAEESQQKTIEKEQNSHKTSNKIASIHRTDGSNTDLSTNYIDPDADRSGWERFRDGMNLRIMKVEKVALKASIIANPLSYLRFGENNIITSLKKINQEDNREKALHKASKKLNISTSFMEALESTSTRLTEKVDSLPEKMLMLTANINELLRFIAHNVQEIKTGESSIGAFNSEYEKFNPDDTLKEVILDKLAYIPGVSAAILASKIPNPGKMLGNLTAKGIQKLTGQEKINFRNPGEALGELTIKGIQKGYQKYIEYDNNKKANDPETIRIDKEFRDYGKDQRKLNKDIDFKELSDKKLTFSFIGKTLPDKFNQLVTLAKNRNSIMSDIANYFDISTKLKQTTSKVWDPLTGKMDTFKGIFNSRISSVDTSTQLDSSQQEMIQKAKTAASKNSSKFLSVFKELKNIQSLETDTNIYGERKSPDKSSINNPKKNALKTKTNSADDSQNIQAEIDRAEKLFNFSKNNLAANRLTSRTTKKIFELMQQNETNSKNLNERGKRGELFEKGLGLDLDFDKDGNKKNGKKYSKKKGWIKRTIQAMGNFANSHRVLAAVALASNWKAVKDYSIKGLSKLRNSLFRNSKQLLGRGTQAIKEIPFKQLIKGGAKNLLGLMALASRVMPNPIFLGLTAALSAYVYREEIGDWVEDKVTQMNKTLPDFLRPDSVNELEKAKLDLKRSTKRLKIAQEIKSGLRSTELVRGEHQKFSKMELLQKYRDGEFQPTGALKKEFDKDKIDTQVELMNELKGMFGGVNKHLDSKDEFSGALKYLKENSEKYGDMNVELLNGVINMLSQVTDALGIQIQATVGVQSAVVEQQSIKPKKHQPGI